jgi:hypothetical protein
MLALTYGKSAIPIVGPTRGSRYGIRRCGRADFSNSGLELTRAHTNRSDAFENAATSTIATDKREDKTVTGDSNGPVFEMRFKRRLRLGAIGVDGRGFVCCFLLRDRTTSREAKGDNESSLASTTPHPERPPPFEPCLEKSSGRPVWEVGGGVQYIIRACEGLGGSISTSIALIESIRYRPAEAR